MTEDYDDNNIMHFGAYRGQKLGDIRMTYFTWLWDKWDREGALKTKLAEDSEDGQLSRYIRSAKKAEKVAA